MNEISKPKSGWRIVRRILMGVAVFATLIAIIYSEENWRGKRAWENYRRAAEALGERLDVASVVPPPVPDEQNFFFAPIVADAIKWHGSGHTDGSEAHDVDVVHQMNFNIWRGDSKLWPSSGSGNWQKGTMTDLKNFQTYFRNFAETPEGKTNGFPVASQPQTPAADILLALSCFDPALKEVRQAFKRPYERMPLDYDQGFDVVGDFLPYLATLKRCAQFLQLRILAELDNGQNQQALDDLKLLLGVTDSVRNQPFLISLLVRMAILHMTLQPVYEGLAQHRWSDEQLAELETELANEDFLADYEFVMRGERAFAIASFENQRHTREIIMPLENGGSVTNRIILMPEAYFYQNELAFAQMHKLFISPLVDLTNRVVTPAALRQTQAAVEALKKHCFWPYKAQAVMVIPAISAGVTKIAGIQSQVDLARVSCALERYRLTNGEYPESLDILSPKFIAQLPHDIINGQPLHYRRTDDGQFILYSVGWNETDDGGEVVLKKSGSVDQEQGDWVWQYPAK
jgi:hypothetical protein